MIQKFSSLRIIAFSVIMILILFILTDPTNIITSISRMDLLFLGMTFLISPIQLTLMTLRWKMMIDTLAKEKIPFHDVLRYTCIGIFGSSITPSKLGDIARSFPLIREKNVEAEVAVYSSVIDRWVPRDGKCYQVYVSRHI